MWETICDAWACWSGWNFGPNSTEYPYSEIQNPPLPPKNENCQRSWHFDFSVSEYPPPQMKIVRDLGTLTFQFQNTLFPPPPKWKLSEILALWLFSFRIPSSPPQKKWKLSEILALWLFSFRIPSPPLKMKIVRDLGTLTFQFQNTPPENWNLGRSWHFVTFQFQNTPPPRKFKFRQIFPMGNYVWQVTTCGDFIQPG